MFIDGKNAALLWAFHGYFVPTKKIVVRKEDGKKAVTKFTIKGSQESVLFLGANLQQVEDHISHLVKTSVNLQPFIYVTGKDIYNIEQIGIYFNSYRYMCNNVIRAFDIIFKIIYLFNLEFPKQSEMFYNFMESCIYKMKNTKPSYPKVSIISEILLWTNLIIIFLISRLIFVFLFYVKWPYKGLYVLLLFISLWCMYIIRSSFSLL